MSDNVTIENIGAELALEHVKNGGNWRDLSEQDIRELSNLLIDDAYRRGYAAGEEAERSSEAQEMLRAYREQVESSRAALDALIAESPGAKG